MQFLILYSQTDWVFPWPVFSTKLDWNIFVIQSFLLISVLVIWLVVSGLLRFHNTGRIAHLKTNGGIRDIFKLVP